MRRHVFRQVLTEAINDIARRGPDDDRLKYWLGRLTTAMELYLPSQEQDESFLKSRLGAAYRRALTPARLKKAGLAGVYEGADLTHEMRGQLSRYLLQSMNLIRRNRREAMETTLSRFSGWVSSVPEGGSKIIDKNKVKGHLSKRLQSQSYEGRRLATDQGHKMISAIDRVVAENTSAIAARWRSNWRRPGYNYREDHKERDDRVYVIRGNWALQAGLMKVGKAGYTDEITQPGEEVSCSCWYEYVHSLRDLPDDMVTAKGRATLLGKK